MNSNSTHYNNDLNLHLAFKLLTKVLFILSLSLFIFALYQTSKSFPLYQKLDQDFNNLEIGNVVSTQVDKVSKIDLEYDIVFRPCSSTTCRNIIYNFYQVTINQKEFILETTKDYEIRSGDIINITQSVSDVSKKYGKDIRNSLQTSATNQENIEIIRHFNGSDEIGERYWPWGLFGGVFLVSILVYIDNKNRILNFHSAHKTRQTLNANTPPQAIKSISILSHIIFIIGFLISAGILTYMARIIYFWYFI